MIDYLQYFFIFTILFFSIVIYFVKNEIVYSFIISIIFLFYIPGFVQFINNEIFWENQLSLYNWFFGVGTLLIFAVIYLCVCRKVIRKSIFNRYEIKNRNLNKYKSVEKIKILILIFVLSFILIIDGIGYYDSIVSFLYKYNANDSDHESYFLHSYYLRMLLVNILFSIIFRIISERMFGLVLAFLLIIVGIVVIPPGSISRTIYGLSQLTVLLAFIYSYKIRFLSYRNIILIAFVFLFPLMDYLRVYIESKGLDGFLIMMESVYLNPGYDSIQSLSKVVDIEYLRFGSTILATLLFFIPRDFWSEKPLGGSASYFDEFKLSYDNISLALPAELYINYHFIGVVIGAFVLGFITIYLTNKSSKNYFNFNTSIIFSLYIIYFMRGDLISSFSQFSFIVFSIYITDYIFKLSNYKFRI